MAITIDGTNGLTTDNAALKLDGTTLVVDDTNNRVGIGTASPSNPLTVRTSGTSTSVGGNIAARIESNGSGYASTLQFSDNVANSSYISMVGSATVFGQAGTERLRILAGGGITFNGDTAAANALDDYEEGTWTPAVSFNGASVGVTYSLQVGRYTKIGNQVTVWGSIALSNKGSSTGSVQITGLPFTSDSTTMYPCMGVNTFSLNANKNTIMQLAASSTNLDLKESATDSNLSNSDFANSTQVRFIFTYRT